MIRSLTNLHEYLKIVATAVISGLMRVITALNRVFADSLISARICEFFIAFEI
jgi:hypothetical protein